jgi:hypothetical protein
MFTSPDASDAVATCPPISPPGPVPEGFFADCNPATNFPGTRPIAEHFNELILNLRALLTQAGIAARKGDPSMLWRAILDLPVIVTHVTLAVAATGVPSPVNPFGGDPFDSLTSALIFLGHYRIAIGGQVTIAIAAGTYTTTQTVVIGHPDGHRLIIQGAGVAATTLSFTGGVGGLLPVSNLLSLDALTIAGDGTVAAGQAADLATGLWVGNTAIVGVGNVTCSGFGGHGVVVDGGQIGMDAGVTLTCTNNKLYGVSVLNNGTVNAVNATISAQNNALAQVAVARGGLLALDTLAAAGGAQGVNVNAAQMLARRLGVDACSTPAEAVAVLNGGRLIKLTPTVVGDWWTWNTGASTPQSFYAETTSFIRADGGFAANNRSNTSPPVNTLGNTQAYILAL